MCLHTDTIYRHFHKVISSILPFGALVSALQPDSLFTEFAFSLRIQIYAEKRACSLNTD